MPENQKHTSIIPMVAFKPAELRIGTDWLIVYYAKDPQSDKLVRFRNRVPKINNKKERMRFAQKMIDTLNEQLYSGWSPYMESLTEVKTIDYCFDYYQKLNLKCKTTKNNIISSYKEDYFFDRKIREDRVLDDLDRLFQN